jgi:hypothetical protein
MHKDKLGSPRRANIGQLNFPRQLLCTALSPNMSDDVTNGLLVFRQEQKKIYNREVDESQRQVYISNLERREACEGEHSSREQRDKKFKMPAMKDEGHPTVIINFIPILKSQSLEVKTRLLYEVVKLFDRIPCSTGQKKAKRDDGGPNEVKSLANESKGFGIFQRSVWISQELHISTASLAQWWVKLN